jgi:hypothetical protein
MAYTRTGQIAMACMELSLLLCMAILLVAVATTQVRQISPLVPHFLFIRTERFTVTLRAVSHLRLMTTEISVAYTYPSPDPTQAGSRCTGLPFFTHTQSFNVFNI